MRQLKTFGSPWQYLHYGVLAMLVLLPFHALFTTWLGSSLGHLDAFRIWKELLLAVMIPVALWLVYRDKRLWAWFASDKLVLLVLLYVLLHIGLGGWALRRGQVTASALIYAMLINIRFLLFMLLCALVAAKTNLAQKWVPLLLGPAIIVIGFGLLQLLILPVNFLAHFGYGPDTIPAVQTVDQKLEYRRIQSTLRGANPLGVYLVLVITALVALLSARREEINNQHETINTKQETGSRKQFRGLLPTAAWEFLTTNYHLLTAIAATLLLFFTYSRSAWLGAAASLGLFTLWTIWQSHFRRWAILLIIGSILVLGSTVGLLRDNDRLQNTLFHSDEHSRSVESSNAGRLRQLEAGAKDVLDEPIGQGPGTAGPASVRNNQPPRIAENYYIQIAQEVGIAGLLLFLGINLVVVARLWAQRHQPLSRILLASLIGITLINMLSHAWTDDTLAYIWWGLAGIVLSPAILKRKHHEKAKEKAKI